MRGSCGAPARWGGLAAQLPVAPAGGVERYPHAVALREDRFTPVLVQFHWKVVAVKRRPAAAACTAPTWPRALRMADELSALRLRCARAEASNMALHEEVKTLKEVNKTQQDEIALLKQAACQKRVRLSMRAASATARRPTPDVPVKPLFDVCCANGILAYRTLRLCARVCKDWRARAEAAAQLLTTLDMSTTFADLGDIRAALQVTGHRLVALDLSHTSGLVSTAERAGELAALIKPTAPTLTSLALSEAEIAEQACPALFQMIGACPKLENLDLSSNQHLRGGSGWLRMALSALTAMRVLNLGCTQIEPHALGVALQRMSALQILRLEKDPFNLPLWVGASADPQAIATFAQSLSQQTSLSELDLQAHFNMDGAVSRSIARALRCMPYMRRLLFSFPATTPDLEFDFLMRQALSNMPFLEHLQIECMPDSSWAVIADSAVGGGGWPCLTFLCLRAEYRTRVTDAACQPIAHALAFMPSIRSLELTSSFVSTSQISAAAGMPLWSALRRLSQLETLHLGTCEIEDVEALSDALANMSSLESLHINLKNRTGKALHSFKMRIPRTTVYT